MYQCGDRLHLEQGKESIGLHRLHLGNDPKRVRLLEV